MNALVSFVIINYFSFCVGNDLFIQSKFTEGENYYKELMKKSYGDCWKTALSKLHSGCKYLTEETQSRLALSFTNCFLQHAGSKPCLCPEDTPISTCLTNSSDRVFSTYTEFFTHTQSICHYLLHKKWQEQTEKTVHLLSENSAKANELLEESNRAQSKILGLQQHTIDEQQKIISNGKILSNELSLSRNHAKDLFNDFKLTTEEHRHLIFQVFDRIKILQGFVLGEVINIYTFAYYVFGIAFIYIFTSVPQTANARFWLLVTISVNVVFEKILSSYFLDAEMLKLYPLDSNVL